MDYFLVAVDMQTYDIHCSVRITEDDARYLYKHERRLKIPTDQEGVICMEPLGLLTERIRLNHKDDVNIPFYVRAFPDGIGPMTYAMLTNTDPYQIDHEKIENLAHAAEQNSIFGRALRYMQH